MSTASVGTTDKSATKGRFGFRETDAQFTSAFTGRVNLFLRVTFLVNVLFTAIVYIIWFAGGDAVSGGGQLWMLQLTVAVTTLNGLLWFLMSRGPRHFVLSIAVSGLSTVGLSLSYTFFSCHQNESLNMQVGVLFALLAVTVVLMLRASLVPSPALSTALVGALSVSGCVMMSHPDIAAAGWVFFVWVAVIASVIVAVSTFMSYTVYRMEEKMFAAAQLGQYRLERLVGRGGMGEVYLATHALLRRATAVKLLRNANSHSAQEHFRHEVQTASSLTHPNTVEIYDYGRTPEGLFYFAMEYVEGATLDDVVRATGAMSAARAVHLLLQAAGSLGEAHGRGLVHRDVKPSNLMLCERGGMRDTLKVLDFGLVREVTETHGEQDATLSGTPLYLAPEAILDADGAVPQSDVYALGATAYYLLTGGPPFPGNDIIEILSDHLATEPPPLVCEDEQLAALVMRALAKAPEDRPADAIEFAAALRECPSFRQWGHDDAKIWWAEHSAVVAAFEREQQAQLSTQRSRTGRPSQRSAA